MNNHPPIPPTPIEALEMLLPALASAISPSKEHHTFRTLALQKGYDAVAAWRKRPTPDTALIEQIKSALQLHGYAHPVNPEASHWYVVDINKAAPAIAALHPTPDRDGLVEKLKAEIVPDLATPNTVGDFGRANFNDGIKKAIAIVRQHEAQALQSGASNFTIGDAVACKNEADHIEEKLKMVSSEIEMPWFDPVTCKKKTFTVPIIGDAFTRKDEVAQALDSSPTSQGSESSVTSEDLVAGANQSAKRFHDEVVAPAIANAMNDAFASKSSVMGRVYTAKGHEADPSVVVPTSDAGPPRQLAPSEISDTPTFEQLLRVYSLIETNFRKFEHMLYEHMNKPKPVMSPVSLEKCAKELAIFQGTFDEFGIREFQRGSAKAVLDAAGVKYV